MKIVVLVKQVPDMERVKFDRERGVIDRKSAGTEVNPFDLNALEAAVQISEQIGAEIVALSMGPPSAEDALKEAIARGADSGVLLSDRKFGGSDVKATAYTLAAAIKKIGNVDLVIAGLQTVDGDTGQVGSEVAEFIDIPNVCAVEKIIEVYGSGITVATDVWDGTYIKNIKFPALITVTKDVNNPRLPSFKSKMKAKKAEIPVWGLEELTEYLSAEQVGIKGSATVVKKIEVPPASIREGEVWRENINEALIELTQIFIDKRILEVNYEQRA